MNANFDILRMQLANQFTAHFQTQQRIKNAFTREDASKMESNDQSEYSKDSLVWEDFQAGAQSMVQRSLIGKKVKIGKNTKLKNCIIFGNVQIGDDCQLTNCLLMGKS
jgi:ADP-glucose pyrophosphorylase